MDTYLAQKTQVFQQWILHHSCFHHATYHAEHLIINSVKEVIITCIWGVCKILVKPPPVIARPIYVQTKKISHFHLFHKWNQSHRTRRSRVTENVFFTTCFRCHTVITLWHHPLTQESPTVLGWIFLSVLDANKAHCFTVVSRSLYFRTVLHLVF